MQKDIIEVTHLDLVVNAMRIAELIQADFADKLSASILNIFPVPRGGIACAYLTAAFLNGQIKFVDNAEDADIAIDDIIDSGMTKDLILNRNPNLKFYAFYENPINWISFPYERTLEGEDKSIDDAYMRLMEYFKISIDKFNDFKTEVEHAAENT